MPSYSLPTLFTINQQRAVTSWLILFCLSTVSLRAQFDLPSLAVLQANGVKAMEIYQQALYYAGGPEEDCEALNAEIDTTPFFYKVFYFNDHGMADSVIYYPAANGRHKVCTYTYNGSLIIGHRELNADGLETSRSELQPVTDQGWVSKGWENGHLRSKTIINTDSIITATYGYYGKDTNWVSATLYDPIANKRTEKWRGSNGAFRIETYTWYATLGQPDSFLHTLDEREAGKNKIIHKQKVYPLDSAGNVVNKYLGRFDDPYLHYNYFDRYETLKTPQFREQSRFRVNTLIDQQEVEHLYTFSGIFLVNRYLIRYRY